ACTRLAEEFDRGGDVGQVRQVGNGEGDIGQQGSGENRQCGVLRSGNANLSIQAVTAGDHQFVHTILLFRLAQVRSAQASRVKNFIVTAWMRPSAMGSLSRA